MKDDDRQTKLYVYPKIQLFSSQMHLTENIAQEQLQVKVHQFFRVHVEKVPSIHLFLANIASMKGCQGA